MASFVLDPRLRLAITIALDPHPAPERACEQEADGRRQGMTGAEIDAARHGRGFDLRTSRALALALACRFSDVDRAVRREQAMSAGLAESLCREIEWLAWQHTLQNGKD